MIHLFSRLILKLSTLASLSDWYLTVRDNDWCDSNTNIKSSSALDSAAANAGSANTSNERLQQLSSDLSPNYATRVLPIPANHKPANHQPVEGAASSAVNVPARPKEASAIALDTNNIIISAAPLLDSSDKSATV